MVCRNPHPRETSTPICSPTRRPNPRTTSRRCYTVNWEEPVNLIDLDGLISRTYWWGGFKTYTGTFTEYVRIWLNRRVLSSIGWGIAGVVAVEAVISRALALSGHPAAKLASGVLALGAAIRGVAAFGLSAILSRGYGIGIRVNRWRYVGGFAGMYAYLSKYAYSKGG